MKISFVGGGVMCEALVSGILNSSLANPEDVVVSEPVENRRSYLESKYSINTVTSNRDILDREGTIVIAVKPQVLEYVFSDFSGLIQPERTVASIVAGIDSKTLQNGLSHQSIARIMPNTPAQIGEGMSVWTADTSVDESKKENVRSMLQTLGHEIYMKDESYLDIATALSGSGPAYVFLFIESLADAGIQLGINEEISYKLALQTVLGSAKLVHETGKSPAELRHMVTSPHGTTEAAIKDLDLNHFREIISSAVHAAYKRSRELGV